MQKLIKINSPANWEIDEINNSYLINGWYIKEMKTMGENNNTLIILLEKETRKEKLQNLDNIANS